MPNIEVISTSEALSKLAIRDDGPAASQTVLVSPLQVNFSQNVIYPKFTDGRNVDDSVSVIEAEAARPEDGLVILKPPFPTIKAVRWAPKHRDGKGRPIRDHKGEEGMFSTDNRRLYCLQRAAVARWPEKCVVQVEVIMDRAELVKHVKKFRTRTNGLSITISEWDGIGRDNAKDFTALRIWDWRAAVELTNSATPATAEKGLATAADTGSIGCWEYLDNKDKVRGPFSNWQMRKWWDMQMLPQSLRVRPYSVADALRREANREGAAASSGNDQDDVDFEQFRPVPEMFEGAPAAFAAGWSPAAESAGQEDCDWKTCHQCQRSRLEGWVARGQWYCTSCWKRWEREWKQADEGAAT